jgi:predicted ATP-grasp superfamily ATP-dependent carboligase
VLVTGTTWGAGLAVVHSLARAGHEVIGVDTRDLRFKIQSRFLSRQYRLPADEENFVSALMQIIRVSRPDLLMPVTESRRVARHKAAFQKRTALLVPDAASYETAYDNARTLIACRQLGIAAPRVLSADEALDALRRPQGARPACVVLKPRADVGGARGVRFVEDPASLRAVHQQVASIHGPAFFQEYIPGPGAMHTVTLLFDRRSELVAAFTMRKLRQWPATGGVSVLAESTCNPPLVDKVLPFFKRWRWQGPAEVELKIDARDGEAKLIEINPRFPGYIGFLVQCGVDLPRFICELVPSRVRVPATRADYAVGAKYLQLGGYAKAIWQDLMPGRHRHRRLARIRSELKGKIYYNHFAWQDWPVLLAKAMTRHRPPAERSMQDVRH